MSDLADNLANPVSNVASDHCFHCGLPVPPHAHYPVEVFGESRAMCCPGCQAVTQAIIDAGLEDYYRFRSELPDQDTAIPAGLEDFLLYDQPDLQREFVRNMGEEREAALILEGITCAACGWLIEHRIGQLAGVRELRVNFANHRARLRWDPSSTQLSRILAAIAAIGYRAHPFDTDRQEALQRREQAVAIRRLAMAGIGAAQVMMLAVALYAGDYHGMDATTQVFLRWISLLITVPVLLYAAQPFWLAAWRDIRTRNLSMDVPVSLALFGAFTASAWVTWQGGSDVYFDSVTMFTFFLLASRYLEMMTRHRAAQVVERLSRTRPTVALRLQDGQEQWVTVAELRLGDRVRIRPGDSIPADGRVESGRSSVDESLLTGESYPLIKGPGAALVGGSINTGNPLIMIIERTGNDTLLAAIVRLLDRAQSEKPRIAHLADRLAGWFVLGVLIIASVVALWWALQESSEAFRITLAVLVVTCPCALSLATPTVLAAATSAMIRRGILVTRGHTLETLAHIDHVIFDKTGTLTEGHPRLVTVHPLVPETDITWLTVAAALEEGSEHPLGQALREAANSKVVAEEVQNFPGQGLQGRVGDHFFRVGSAGFASAGADVSPPSGDPSSTWIALGDGQRILAWFECRDPLRSEAQAVVTALQRIGKRVSILSGDRPATVAASAASLGIEDYQGGLLPADKLAHLRVLHEQGAVTAMVGDGINDAPILAGASVGIAMGNGAALAHSAADMVLLGDRLTALPEALGMGQRSLAVIRQNLGWAIVYNIIALPLAAGGWLLPWMAALGMSLSSLVVVANASRLGYRINSRSNDR